MLDLENITILVVEDDNSLLEILSNFLQLDGAKVFSAETGKEALEIITHNLVDFVIADIQMPIMTGVELLEKIRKIDPKIPIVLLTTGQAHITTEDAIKKGAIGIIYKPFDFDILKAIIINSLSKD